ncbi:MAG: chemotaxis protein CheB [Pseudomonadota bacterium]|nr:chemotaxis protein CheB [Pseudomonadota bacterium]
MAVKTTSDEILKKIKVLIVDDAAFMRKAIFNMIEGDAQIEVVGTARNGQEGLEQIEKLHPDVITLDIDMPIMDGITSIRHIMIKSPVPVVVLSSLFNDGTITFDALRLGVVDFIPKPSGAVSTDIDRSRQHLIDRIKLASEVNMSNIRRVRLPQWEMNKNLDHYGYRPLDYLLALGTTLSGPNTIVRLLANLPPTLPAAVVVVVEMSPKILSAFIERFDMLVPWEICEAQDGIQLKQGVCYLSSYQNSIRVQTLPDGTYGLKKAETTYEPLNQLFTSAADAFQQNTIGVLLTGIGTDGAEGFAYIQKMSGVTLAQNTQTCVYPNLTDNAIKRGTVNTVLDETELPQAIISIMDE